MTVCKLQINCILPYKIACDSFQQKTVTVITVDFTTDDYIAVNLVFPPLRLSLLYLPSKSDSVLYFSFPAVRSKTDSPSSLRPGPQLVVGDNRWCGKKTE